MRRNSFPDVVQKAVQYMQQHLGRSLKMPEVAQHVFLSESQLRRAFRTVTGKSLFQVLQQMRMDRARELLGETDLTIAEVAELTGFPSHRHFSTAFKLHCKTTPKGFRATRVGIPVEQSRPKSKDPTLRFYDDFRGTVLGNCWKKRSGSWKQENGSMAGEGEGDVTMRFETLLPENFRLSFDLQFEPGRGTADANATLALGNGTGSGLYCVFRLGARGNATAEMAHSALGEAWNEKGKTKIGTWQSLEFEMKEEEGVFRFEGEELFRFRDPFPPPYSSRCKIQIGCYNGRVRYRNFRIHDLGFSLLVRAVRQGDLLFNNGLYAQALDFYVRQLDSADLSFADTMELRFKIGLCLLRQNNAFQADSWLDKVVVLPETDYWKQQAELVRLELLWKQRDHTKFEKDARRWFEIPAMRMGVRQSASHATQEYRNRGFHREELAMAQLRLLLEEEGSYAWLTAHFDVAEAALYANQPGVAASHFQMWIDLRTRHAPKALWGTHNLAFALSLQGRYDESDRVLEKLESAARDEEGMAIAKAYRAINVKGRGQFREALAQFSSIVTEFPKARGVATMCLLHQSHMLACLGQAEEARELFEEGRNKFQIFEALRPGQSSVWEYVPYFVGKEFGKATELLLADSRFQDNQVAVHAQQAAKAGISAELGGNAEQARSIWQEGLRAFPPERCCFIPPLMQRLINGEADGLDDMHYHPWEVSEMCYLVGVLWEKRGNGQRAKELFKRSVAVDGTLGWAAWLAKEKLGEEA